MKKQSVKMDMQWVAAITLALVCTQACAINKCTDVTGRLSFQDAPCTGKGEQIKVTPASGYAEAPAPSNQAPSAPGAAPADKKQSTTEKMYDALKDERIRREKWVVMNEAHSRLAAAQQRCDKEQVQLAASKGYSNNNLAGATRDVSISQQMTAAAAACTSRMRLIEREVDAADKVCTEIKCIQPF